MIWAAAWKEGNDILYPVGTVQSWDVQFFDIHFVSIFVECAWFGVQAEGAYTSEIPDA